MKTSELIGPALDWAVAKCEGFDTRNNYRCQVIDSDDIEYIFECFADDDEHAEEQALDAYPNSEVHLIEYIGVYSPSTDWAHGGPIIERENIALRESKGKWYAITSSDLGDGEGARWILYTFKTVPKTASKSRQCRFSGPTPLIAAMRCYVASKLGDEVKIPKELK